MKRIDILWVAIFTAIIFFILLIISGWPPSIFSKSILAILSYFAALGMYVRGGVILKIT